MHWFLKFIFGIKLYMIRTVPLSIIRSFSACTQQLYMSYRFCWQLSKVSAKPVRHKSLLCSAVRKTCMTYTIAVCTLKNSWWQTQELSETCRVLFQKLIWEISASGWFYYKNLFYLQHKQHVWNETNHNCKNLDLNLAKQMHILLRVLISI